MPSKASAQVIIKERMELDAKDEQNDIITNFPDFDDISRPELNSESLFPISFDRLLVLRDGNLIVHFNDAIGSQTINPDQTPLTVKVIRDGQSQTILVDPASYLPKPLEISNSLVQCTELIYNTRPYTLKTEDDSLVVEDADLFKQFERFYNSGQWFEETDYSRSDLNFLSVSRTILNETGYYSELEQRSFVKYDLSYLQTNGRLDSAALFLTPTNFYPETDPSELDPFYIIPVTSSWSEDNITWQDQPSVSSSARLVDQNFLEGISYKIDVTEQVRPWLEGAATHGWGLFPDELPGTDDYEETVTNLASSEHAHSNNAQRRPYLQLQLNNPNSPPNSQQFDTLSLKAEDVIQLAYPESEKAFFTEYDSNGYDVLFSSHEGCSREELDITLGLQPANTADSVWIQVELKPGNIAPGDTSEIIPRLAFSDGSTQDFPPGQRFDGALVDGTSYGSLLDEFTGDTADLITNTPAGFKFIASDSILEGSAVSVINVNTILVPGGDIIIGEAPDMPVPTPVMGATDRETSTSPTARQQASSSSPQPSGLPLSGTGQVVIREDSVRFTIEIPDTAEVWPTIPSDGTQANFDLEEVENSIEEVLVTLSQNGEPIANQEISISAEWVSGSGGHDHNGGDDLLQLPQNQLGWIVDLADGDSSRSPLDTITDDNGQVQLRYWTPEFGGKVVLKAETEFEDDSLSAQDTLTAKVPDLILLSDINSYETIGGTPSHHGPRLDSRYPNSRSPDNNHWVNETVGAILVSFSIICAEQFPNSPTVRYNDISLSYGGRFDINGRWSGSHILHRLGQNVDIRTSPPQDDGISLLLLQRVTEIVTDIDPNATVEIHGSVRTDENGERHDSRHFHIDFEIF